MIIATCLKKQVVDSVGEDGKLDEEKASKNQQDAQIVSEALKGVLEEAKLLEGDVERLFVKNAEFEVVTDSQSILAKISGTNKEKVQFIQVETLLNDMEDLNLHKFNIYDSLSKPFKVQQAWRA